MAGKYSIKAYLKLADIVTIFSMLSGFAAIILFSHGNFSNGSVALLFATFFDFIDGKIARMQGGGTAFGKAIDFADLISFGAAPAVLISAILPNYIGYAVAAIFLTASLLRLARFQIIEADFSVGMPTTFNGLIFPAIYFLQSQFALSEYVYPIVALVCAFLMLKSFELKKKI